MTITHNSILSIKQVAIELGVSERTVRNYLIARRNPMPHSKPGGKVLIHYNDLLAWAKTRKS